MILIIPVKKTKPRHRQLFRIHDSKKQTIAKFRRLLFLQLSAFYFLDSITALNRYSNLNILHKDTLYPVHLC